MSYSALLSLSPPLLRQSELLRVATSSSSPQSGTFVRKLDVASWHWVDFRPRVQRRTGADDALPVRRHCESEEKRKNPGNEIVVWPSIEPGTATRPSDDALLVT
jgi:hypothetical protein